MNILIVGNGFDLSHYLPTKYDHFMDVMKAIEEKDLGQHIANVFKDPVEDLPTLLLKAFQIKNALNEKNYEMNFNELFSKCREQWFIEKTKVMYSTDSIKLKCEKIIEIQYLLKNNGWYQYFKNHVEEIKTWIDFEQKIEEVLIAIAECITLIDQAYSPLDIKDFLDPDSKDKWKIKEKNFKRLNFFDLWQNEEYVMMATEYNNIISTRPNLNSRFCHGGSLENGFSQPLFLSFLNNQLEDFIEIFNLYLELIVSQLSPINRFSIQSEDWIYPDKIFSFNYTNTYQRIHDSIEVEYLHGRHGVEQNIVLGVSDLEDGSLKKIKAYGFTKYHQKLFKETDYLFLDKYKNKILSDKSKIDDLKENISNGLINQNKSRPLKLHLYEVKRDQGLDLNFYIWGHSLDVSDKDYIIDLFSLNDGIDRNVRVIVYHFNKTAKFDLLNNLLAILDKDKVEHWMKNKWLQFKENPKIVPESAITLEDLPKV